MKNKYQYFLVGIIVIGFISVLVYKGNKANSSSQETQSGSHIVQVVAAENFYGDIVQQLGGNHVSVLSILSDPNVDPHSYESNVQDAIAVNKANLVIKNGVDYDTWMDKLLSASPNKSRVVLTAADIATHQLPDNPHIWYGINNVPEIATKITNVLKQEDPADASEFDQNLTKFNDSLSPIRQTIQDIKTNFANTPVALSETIYLYQTQLIGLNVLTPLAYEKAINEGNEPSAEDVATADDQVNNKQVKVLIYDAQNATPVTANLQHAAQQQNIPIVSVTETMPPHTHYQNWMEDQLAALEQALQTTK
ncbi:MAG: metal ABC transporter solute-binding protein, Zn/Mn family [Candidatus Levyibacteriota bacterium]